MHDEHSKEKRITIKDIARLSGYSKTAVSFAFNDPSRISAKACATILQVAQEVGYYPNPLARNFSLQNHQSIGFLLPQDINYSFRNPYIMEVLLGIGAVCQKHGNTLTLIPPLHESVVEAVRCAAVDGLITQGMGTEMEVFDLLLKRKLPFVTIDGVPSAKIPSVNVNDKQAAYDIMRLVLAAGHRRIAIVSLLEVTYERSAPQSIQKIRLAGYVKALQEYGLNLFSPTIIMHTCACTIEEGRHLASILINAKQRPTCVVTMSDIVAIGVILAFKEHHIAVPDDISVVGFDNIPESAYHFPSLTTVDQPGEEKGRQAAQLLFSLISKEELVERHIQIPYRIIERESLKNIS